MGTFQTGIPLFIFSFSCFFLGFSPPSSAETLYVKTSKTKLLALDSVNALSLMLLKKGTPVTVLVKSKRLYKVSLENGKKGWIFKFKLSEKAFVEVGEGEISFADVLRSHQNDMKESTSALSIRGLSPVSKSYAKNKGISSKNIRAVDNIESYSIDSSELNKFLQEGGLQE